MQTIQDGDKILSSMVSADGINPLPDKLEAIRTGQCPTAFGMLGRSLAWPPIIADL